MIYFQMTFLVSKCYQYQHYYKKILNCFRYRQQWLFRRTRFPMPRFEDVRARRQGRLQLVTPAEVPAHHAESLGGDRSAGGLRQGARLCRLHSTLHTSPYALLSPLS